jgi:hypothetical protein
VSIIVEFLTFEGVILPWFSIFLVFLHWNLHIRFQMIVNFNHL